MVIHSLHYCSYAIALSVCVLFAFVYTIYPNMFLVFKALCVPETCPEGFRLVSNQPSSAHCYMYHAHEKGWEEALVSMLINHCLK